MIRTSNAYDRRTMALYLGQASLIVSVILAAVISNSVLASTNSLSIAQSLATERQFAFEKTAEAILKTPEMQKTKEEARQLLLASKLANSDSAKQTLQQALSEMGGYAALTAATKDPQNPGLVWIQTPRKEWMGHTVSGSRFYFDNPDNIYRYALIDDTSTYVLDTRPTGPTGRFSVTIYQALTGAEVDDWEKQAVNTADSERIKFDNEGAARITIGPVDPKDGNLHLNSRGGALVIVREALSDPHSQRPQAMSFRRVAGPDSQTVTFQDRVAIAQRYMMLAAKTVADYDEIVYPLPTNSFAPSVRRAQGVKPSMMKMGLFHLADDEVLIVNVLPQGAEFSNFSVTSPWMVTRNFIGKTGSRTSRQSHQNADGTYTYVVSPRDPGVANWIDTDGLLDGGMAMRWEGMNAPEDDPNGAVKSVKLVKFDAIRSELPADFPVVSPAERLAEIAARQADYEALCGAPCKFTEK